MSTTTEEITVLDLGPATDVEFPAPPPAADGAAPEAGTPPNDAEGEDPEAPYGRKADGTPKAKPGRRPRGGIPRTAKIQPAKPRKTAAPRPATKKPAGPDYAGAVMGLLQLPAAGLALAGAKDPRFLADAVTLEVYGPPVAQALADVAREQPAVAAVLDRLMHVGPYGALIAAVSPLVFQVAANHGLIPAGQMGTKTLDELVAQATGQAK